jgi:DNA polymerase-3 subunit beta
MKLAVIKGHLKDAVTAVVGATSDNQNLPILKNILIEAINGAISLTATNLEIAIRVSVPGKVMEDGAITVPASTFLQIVTNLGSERIGMETKGGVLEIKTDAYEATVQGVSAEEYPLIPTVKEERGQLRIKGILLKDAVAQVVIAAQPSELRPELGSILFNFTLDSLKLAATDSFRLAEKTFGKTQFSANYKEAFKMLIPLKTSQELLRVLHDEEEVLIRDDGNQVSFETPTTFIVSRLIEGNFPDYSVIIPKDFGAEILTDAQEFVSAIKLAAVFGQKITEVKIKIQDNKKSIQISSAEQGLGENTSVLSAKIEGDPKDISFNWRYLQDGVKATKTKEIFLGLNKEDGRAALIRAPHETSYFYIVMPILKA